MPATKDAYQNTIERMEPDVSMIDPGGGWASIAISLKRIADVLERNESAANALANAALDKEHQGR